MSVLVETHPERVGQPALPENLRFILAPDKVNDNGREYNYVSPAGSLDLTLGEGQSRPFVFWRPTQDRDEGEFLIGVGKGRAIDLINTTARVTFELPVEEQRIEGKQKKPVVSMENGSAKIKKGNHGVMYVELDGEVDAVYAHGTNMGREAHLLIPENSFVKDLYLRGNTYLQTHDLPLTYHFIPHADVFGTIHVGNGRILPYNNDRINGYELGYGEYSLEQLRAMEYHGLDRERSGHYINLRAEHTSKKLPKSSRHTGNGETTVFGSMTTVLSAIPQKADLVYINGAGEKSEPQIARIPVIEAVPWERDIWSAIRANFRAAGVELNVYTLRTAVILTEIAASTAPEGMRNMLSAQALRLLATEDLSYPLKMMINGMRYDFDYVEDIVVKKRELGEQMLSEMNRVLNEKAPEVNTKRAVF